MKLLEMDRVKAVWNRYAANKIILIMIKSENIWLNWNSFDDIENLQMTWEITWEIQEKVSFSEKGRKVYKGFALSLLKKSYKLGHAFYKPEG